MGYALWVMRYGYALWDFLVLIRNFSSLNLSTFNT